MMSNRRGITPEIGTYRAYRFLFRFNSSSSGRHRVGYGRSRTSSTSSPFYLGRLDIRIQTELLRRGRLGMSATVWTRTATVMGLA